jgi:hypothetical protein
MSEKSILEQALLQVQTLEEAVKANAKGILASTMKQELGDLLKESMEDEEKEVKEQPTPEEDPTDDVSAKADDETGDDKSDEDDDESSDEPTKGIDDKDSSEDDDDDMGNMFNMGGFGDDEDDNDVVDMTGADEDEILKVFKAMSPEDGVIVKKDDDHIELSDGDDEYIIKLGEEDLDETMMSEEDLEEGDESEYSDENLGEGDESEYSDESLEEMMDDSEETVYEIELDDTNEDMSYEDDDETLGGESLEEYVDETYEEGYEPMEGDVEESARTMGNGYHGGIKSKKKFYAGNKREEINEEVSKLRKQNDEYKKALVLFKEKLNEVAVFNANLAYATRLFTEHSTTKQEKLNILKRFDSISTLKESKNLYSSIKTELDTKKPVTESVVDKITTAPTSSSSQKVLSESKAYENPQFKRMKDLMSKLK